MRLIWTPEAGDDLADIFAYIAYDSEQAANRTVRKLIRGAEKLAVFPFVGRPGRVPGTREWVYANLPYVAVYRVEENIVSIVRIVHGARNRPTIH